MLKKINLFSRKKYDALDTLIIQIHNRFKTILATKHLYLNKIVSNNQFLGDVIF